VSYTIPHKD